MVIRMRHTKSHSANRRSHHALKSKVSSKCPNCGSASLPHRACQNCGKYKGREVVDVFSKVDKKEEKQKKQKSAENPKEEKIQS